MSYTLTYSESAKGWTSFYSFKPEIMIGMNNRFYSFYRGNLYIHNSNNVERNKFYGEKYKSTITGVINDSPSEVKTFKTISLESTAPWSCTVTSDLGSGYIDKNWFTLKEGDYYAHIRRNSNDSVLEMRSLQGIGTVSSVDSSVPASTVITFSFKPDSMISSGDKMYVSTGGSVAIVGTITSTSGNDITVDASSGTIPSPSNFVMYMKNPIAESYGTTGYYLEYHLELPVDSSNVFVEIFGIGSSLFKSYP